MSSNMSKDDILELKPAPRPVVIPNAIIGYFGDIVINITKYKIAKYKTTSQKDSH